MQGRLLRRRGIATFAVLVACAEVAGRALTRHVDSAFHVTPLASTDTSYYPFLLVGVKAVGALTLAALAARALARLGGRRRRPAPPRRRRSRARQPAPRLRPGLSIRVWLAAFAATSVVYLVHADTENAVAGRWPLLAPWLHTYALPVFALLAVLVALAWRLAGFLHEIEDVRGPHARARPQILARRQARAAALRAARSTTTPRLGAASASRSSHGLLRSPPRPAVEPSARGRRVVAPNGRRTMNTTYVTTEAARAARCRAHSRSRCSGRSIAAAGIVWAILQPYRITLLHPHGQGFWWLVLEPPLLVVAAGIVFAVVVARPLLADLERHRATTR